MPDILTKRVKPLQVIPVEVKVDKVEKSSAHYSYVDLMNLAQQQAKKIILLEQRISEAEDQLEAQEKGHVDAQTEAVRLARLEERSAIEISSQKIIAAGIESLKSGRVAFDDFLQTSEGICLNLLEQVLQPLFTDPIQLKESLAKAIGKAVQNLGETSVLNVRLNSEDFGNPTDLFAIVEDLKDGNMSFEIDPTLQSGESIFELLVGQYEISLPEHWASLQDLMKSAIQFPSSEKTPA